jgi:aryl-alcohol dehydrogenase-like predicted oxidoreductase
VKYGSIPPLGDRVSRLVLGSASLSTDNQDLVNALLDAFVAAGGNAVDTAREYGRGKTEQAIGNWLRAHDRRSDIFLITKGAHPVEEGVKRVTPEAIDADVAGSLGALGVDTIDLYLLHRDDPDVPVGPIVDCLNRHFDAGHLRGFGASNWSHQRIVAANDYAATNGLRGFIASSPNLALAVPREVMWWMSISVAGDAEALAWYRQTQLPVLPWSSLASGFFSGRFTPEDCSNAPVVRTYYTDGNWERYRRVQTLASRYDCSTTQIALAWALNQPFPTFPLIGPLAVSELTDCLAALDVPLTPADGRWLNLEE